VTMAPSLQFHLRGEKYHSNRVQRSDKGTKNLLEIPKNRMSHNHLDVVEQALIFIETTCQRSEN